MKIVTIALFVFLLTGCVVSATEEGMAVRVIDTQSDYDCKFVREVTGYGTASAMIQIRNRAAKLGANAVRINHLGHFDDGGSAILIAEALNCVFND